MANSSLDSQIYSARTNLLSQLKSQGYDVNGYIGFTLTEINAMVRYEQLDFVVEKENGQKTFVKFHIAQALRPAQIKDMVEAYYNIEETLTKNDNLYIITMNDPNDTLIKMVNNIWLRDGIYVMINSVPRLRFNVLEHSLVPKFTVLNEEEDKEFRKKYNITNNSQIPNISRFDPVAVAIGMRPGQICKILRPSRTAITAPYYRICVI